MAIVTGDRYIERLVKFVEQQAGPLIEGTLVLKLNPVGLHYVQSRLEALNELESLLAGAPVDYLRAYVSDLGDHRALEQLRRILRLLTSLKVVSVLQAPARDPTPLSLLPFGRLRVLELRGCDLSTSAAKGLLELRHTLEKIICHNSTDALRHIFASRIAEIKGSPQWKRLSFVSCACNGLVLMDESLQLLPAVETLDLSRNKFAKVDNLRKCVKLKHLDLGFNQLRAISSFSEVSCHIGKLVLRNNALTTFRGIENLKSLEGLDVSYNIISNFSELEFLSGLQFLQNLWLEGNPICCARWYRPQVFGYFSHPEKLKLDDKEISTREMWKRQLIIARRQRRPASFGFYSPAKCDATGEGSIHRKRKKVTRLALIEGEEESTYLNSDEESVSIDNEIQSREEAVVSDNEAEIVDLMNRVELMKKERSILWLREFKEWMDHTSENFVDHTKYCTAILDPGRENLIKTKPSHRHYGESSRYASDSVQASGDESSTNVLESDSSFTYTTAGLHAEQYFERTGLVGNTGGVGQAGMGKMDLKEEYLKAYPYERISSVSAQPKSSRADIFVNQGGHRTADNLSISPLTTIDDISESHSSSAYPGSPPHYQEDILHRRHYLEEEILQLSAESYSIASSDSNTSCSQDDICDFMPSTSGTDQAMNGEYSNNFSECPYLKNFEGNCYGQRHQISHMRENGQCATNSYVDQIFGKQKLTNPDHSVHSHNDIPAGTCDDVNKEDDFFDKRKSRRKTKRRVISLIDDNISAGKVETSEKTNGNHGFHVAEGEQEQPSKSIFGSDFQKDIDRKYILTSKIRTPLNEDALGSPEAKCLSLRCDDFIKNYFNTNVADSKSHEICMQYMRCYCVLEQAFQSREREVALILSSKQKMYVLLFGGAGDETGTTLSLLGCHRVEDIREVFVGVGLQVVRVCIERSATYLFITRDVEKSRQLLCSLQNFDSFGANDKCCLRSLEQVQVELFEKQIFGGLKVSIFQYSMVLFWYNNHEEGSWVSRSLFVTGVHLLMCIEDLVRFGSLSEDASSPPYYSLDSCCAINDISEMVVEAKESCCVTLQLECATSVFNPSAKFGKGLKGFDKKTASSSLAWKLKWFSEESLFKFVALVKAIHSGTSTSPLLIRCTS